MIFKRQSIILCLLFTSILFTSNSVSQEYRLGVSGDLLIGLSETNEDTRREFRNLGILSIDFQVFLPGRFPIIVGLSAGSGDRNVLRTSPVEKPATLQEQVGLERNLRMTTIGLPVAYRWRLNRQTSLNAGIEVGAAFMKVDELVNLYAWNDTQNPIGRATTEVSDAGFYLLPSITLTRELSIPFFITIGAGYRFLNFDTLWPSQENNGFLLRPFLSVDRSSFDFSDWVVNASLHLRLWRPDVDE